MYRYGGIPQISGSEALRFPPNVIKKEKNMKNNLTEIRKKKSFWHLFVKMNTEIQVIFTVGSIPKFV